MELIVCKDLPDLVARASKWVSRLVEEQSLRDFYVPAGTTPRPLYAHWRHHQPDFLKRIRFIQIDDVISGLQAGCFKKFFETELAPWKKQIVWFDRGEVQAEAAILGLGLNGHIAFHEPEIPKNFYSGCVKLDEVTRRRLDLEPNAWGVSYGLTAFLKCREILMIVSDESKRTLLQKIIQGDGNFPARYLAEHPKFILMTDLKGL